MSHKLYHVDILVYIYHVMLTIIRKPFANNFLLLIMLSKDGRKAKKWNIDGIAVFTICLKINTL